VSRDENSLAPHPASSHGWVALGLLTGWLWTIVAGGGGLWLLFTKGPWPLTNGWFALASGISACPLTGRALRRRGVAVSWQIQFALALVFFVAGRIALLVGL